jgi:hypothetical protein
MVGLCSGPSGFGFFNYSYDEVNIAPDAYSNLDRSWVLNSCFVIQRPIDSDYLKCSITEKLSDGRYVYRYDLSTTPNDRLLVGSNYDRSIKYKPNNFYHWKQYYNDSVFWDPPLSNNNHLLGYIIYKFSSFSSFDTSALPGISQWDSVTFTTGTRILVPGWLKSAFYNIVAVYVKGRTDFLKGWLYVGDVVGIKPQKATGKNALPSTLIRSQVSFTGYLFTFPSLPLSAALFDPAGHLIANLAPTGDNRLYWRPSSGAAARGMYLMQARMPNNRTIVQKFMTP